MTYQKKTRFSFTNNPLKEECGKYWASIRNEYRKDHPTAKSITYIWFYSCLIMQLYIFIVMTMYSHCMFMSDYSNWGFFPWFFLNFKSNSKVKPAKTGHGPHSSSFFLLFYVFFVLFYVFLCCSIYFFVLCRSVYCLCVYVYCTTATGWLPNYSWIYHISDRRSAVRNPTVTSQEESLFDTTVSLTL